MSTGSQNSWVLTRKLTGVVPGTLRVQMQQNPAHTLIEAGCHGGPPQSPSPLGCLRRQGHCSSLTVLAISIN